MAVTFQQTDTSAGCGESLFCANATMNNDRAANADCTQSGTAGSTEQNVRNGNSTDLASVFFQCSDPPTGTNWNSGTWTINLDITTGNSTIVWQEAYVCHIDGSGCTNIGTIGSTTGLGITMSAGTHSANVSGSEISSPSSGDDIYIVCVFDFTNNHGNEQMGLTPSETISSPIAVSQSFTESITETVGT